MTVLQGMHIGLNLVYLVPGETGGTEVVARELVPELVSARPDVRFTAFINREAAAQKGLWNDVVESVTVPVRAGKRLQWVRGEQQLLPRLAARAGVDLVHSLANTGPVHGSFTRVVTIHDLIHRVYPETHFGPRALGMRMLVTAAARRSHLVIADSESTREDLVRLLGLSPDRIDVAPLGVGDPGAEARTPEAELRSRLALGDRMIVLSVSAKRPHKNLLRLIDAIARIPAARRPLLVLPGYPTPHERDLRSRAAELGIETDVRLLDWVSDADLAGLYAAARCFAFPSLYEGFGLPVLEAMAHGVPVACSDRGSLREVASSAALLFDPEQPSEIAAAIDRLIGDEAEADRLRAAGREQAARFTWRATAAATLRAYERALSRS
jgi:glycosyltransferase involved in cell wall biosynthesis